ncbi:MAG: UDP binding domain-containing protein, partial [Halioglobus sp.]|nr:UDP binding domain-containing protein [Halioglobus sp.]
TARKIRADHAKILVLGFTFKENCGDIRNTRVADVVEELGQFGCDVSIFDPWADPDSVAVEYGAALLTNPAEDFYDAVLIAVAHDYFREMGSDGIKRFCKSKAVIYDLKYVLPDCDADIRL